MLCSFCAVRKLVLRLFPFGINITGLNPSGIRKDGRIKCSGMLRLVVDVWKGRIVFIFTVRQSKSIVMTSKRRHVFVCRHSVTSEMAWNFATPLWAPKICRPTQHIVCTVHVHSYTNFLVCRVFVTVTLCKQLKALFRQTYERQCRFHPLGSLTHPNWLTRHTSLAR